MKRMKNVGMTIIIIIVNLDSYFYFITQHMLMFDWDFRRFTQFFTFFDNPFIF